MQLTLASISSNTAGSVITSVISISKWFTSSTRNACISNNLDINRNHQGGLWPKGARIGGGTYSRIIRGRSVLHICEDSDGRSFPQLSLQPPLMLELVRILTPKDLIAIKTKTNDFSNQGRRMRREACRLLRSVSPLARTVARVALISSQSFFWISGCLASSRKAKDNVWALVSSEENISARFSVPGLCQGHSCPSSSGATRHGTVVPH